MADEEEVIVAVAGEADETIEKREPETKVPEKDDPTKALAKQYEELEARAERERQARDAADRRAEAASREAVTARRDAAQARTETTEREYDTVLSGIEAAKSEATAAEGEYQAAFEKGDAVAMSGAQRKIARAEAKSVRLDEARADIEARRSRTTDEAEQRKLEAPQRPEPPADPVDAYIATRTEPTARWLREHKDWIADQRKNAKLTAAHYSAMGEGIAVDTPEYFEHVEGVLGLRGDTAGNGTDKTPTAPTKAAKRAVPPVAPGAPSSGGTNGGGTEVRLTRGEAAAATDGTHIHNYDDPSPQKRFKKGDVIGIQEMARRKLEMQKQGLYDKSYTEA